MRRILRPLRMVIGQILAAREEVAVHRTDGGGPGRFVPLFQYFDFRSAPLLGYAGRYIRQFTSWHQKRRRAHRNHHPADTRRIPFPQLWDQTGPR